MFMGKESLTRRGRTRQIIFPWNDEWNCINYCCFGFKSKCNSSVSKFLSPEKRFFDDLASFFRKQLRTKDQKELALKDGWMNAGRCRTWVILLSFNQQVVWLDGGDISSSRSFLFHPWKGGGLKVLNYQAISEFCRFLLNACLLSSYAQTWKDFGAARHVKKIELCREVREM